jgi:H+/Cl- antiporter ClcA
MSESNSLLKAINQIAKWLIICLLISSIVGSITAFFLYSLDVVTNFRENHFWIIYTLPITGFFIGYIYYQYGDDANKGNNAIIEAHHVSHQQIHFKMAPLVYMGTILTHLSGGSAGREGTAVQMGSAIVAPFTKWFKLNELEKKTIIIMGVSAGFACSVWHALGWSHFCIGNNGF